MLWALVVALFAAAIACASAVIGWHQVTQLSKRLDESEQRVATALEGQANSQRENVMAAKEKASEALSKVYDLELDLKKLQPQAGTGGSDGGPNGHVPAEFDERMTERARQAAATALRRWADVHFTAATGDAAQSEQLVRQLADFATYSLEREVAAPRAGSRILRCRLYAQQPSVLDIGPGLVNQLWSALNAELIYQQPDAPDTPDALDPPAAPDGVKSYVRWPRNGPAPETQLGSLLATARRTGALSASEAGITQLHAVMGAIHAGGPAVVELGPLLVARTGTRMSARFAPVDWSGMDRSHLAAAIDGVPDLLERLGAGRVDDLTDWDDSQAA